MVVFLGRQPGSGMYPNPRFQVYLRFEIPSERVEFEKDGKKFNLPAVIGNAYTASMGSKANIRKHLEGWRGKQFTDDEAASFDVASILGKCCMLSVVEKTTDKGTYSNIASMSKLPKGLPEVKAENPLYYYAPDDVSCFESLPQWMRDKIDNQIKLPEKATDPDYDPDGPPASAYDNTLITDDDIPF
jgi:hypothetical protein